MPSGAENPVEAPKGRKNTLGNGVTGANSYKIYNNYTQIIALATSNDVNKEA